MKRREFITLIGGAAAVWPFAARTQERSGKIRLVALLSSSSKAENERDDTAFRNRLATLGWKQGDNVRIESRYGESSISRARSLAADLVAMRPDVFLATNTQMVQLILEKTRNVPIVFINVPDPIGSGLVTSFARPGGNVTGFTNFEPSIAGKWLEFLKDVAPDVNRVAVLLQTENPTAAGYQKAIDAAAPTFSVKVTPLSARDGPNIDTAVETFAREPGGGLVVSPSALAVQYRERIIGLAARYRVPAIYPYSEFVASGGLVGYGIDRRSLSEQAASYIDRILKGEKARDLPVQRPTKFQLEINLKTAKTLRLTVPKSMLLLADEIIE